MTAEEKAYRRRRNKITKNVQARLEEKGLYSPEFDSSIIRYADMTLEYETLLARYIADGYPFEVDTQNGTKKAPIVTTLESLRQMLLAYENALGLTPRADKRLSEGKTPKEASGLGAILNKLDEIDYD